MFSIQLHEFLKKKKNSVTKTLHLRFYFLSSSEDRGPTILCQRRLSKNGFKKGLKGPEETLDRRRERWVIGGVASKQPRRIRNPVVHDGISGVIENEGTINEFNDRRCVKIWRSADLRFPPRGLNYGALRIPRRICKPVVPHAARRAGFARYTLYPRVHATTGIYTVSVRLHRK